MKTIQVRTLRDFYNMTRKWIVKGKDTPLNVELEITLDESSNLVTVKVLGDENIVDNDDIPSLFNGEGDSNES